MKTIDNEPLLAAIKKAHNIAVLTHKQPDADGIGSMLAICHVLELLGKKASAYCHDTVPENIKYLPNAEKVLLPDEFKSDADLIISVDVSDKERLGNCLNIFESNSNTIQIDHHATNTMFAKINEVDPSAAASGMLVFRLAKALNVPLDSLSAQYLYVAISSDTGNFCFPSVTAETFEQMAELMRAGLDIAFNAQQIHLLKSRGKINITSAALKTLSYHMDGMYTSMCLYAKDFENCNANRDESDGIVNLGLYIRGVKAAYLATESDDGIKFSLRCLKPYDVSNVAKLFGGGGHKLAAGCSINSSMESAMDKMNTAIENMLKS